jgi:hypothetical protein
MKHLNELEVPPDGLIDGINWFNRYGRFKTRPGLTAFADDIDERPMGFWLYNHEDENNRLVMGTKVGWHHYDAVTGLWVDITGGSALTGGDASQVVFRTFPKGGDTYLISCNGNDSPKQWDGLAATYSNVGGSPPATARAMAVSGKRLLLATGYNIKVSTLGDFDTGWGFELDVNLYDTPGDIVCLMERGNLATVVYKETSIWNAFAQEELVAPFRFEVAVASVPGPVSPLAVVPIEDGSHCYMAENGAVYRFDGVNAMSLGEHIQAAVWKAMDLDKIDQAWGVYDSYSNELWFFFVPTGASDINYALMISFPDMACHAARYHNHYLSAGIKTNIETSTPLGEVPGVLGDQDLELGDFSLVSGALIFGEIGGQVYKSSGDDDDGEAINHSFETGLDLDPGIYLTLNEIYVDMETPASDQEITVTPTHSDHGERPVGEQPKVVQLKTTGVKRSQHRITARRHGIQLSGSNTEQLEYAGARYHAAPRGLR